MQQGQTNGHSTTPRPKCRSEELNDLLEIIQPLLTDFIDKADPHPRDGASTNSSTPNTLLDIQTPQQLTNLLKLELPTTAQGPEGLLQVTERILHYSINTHHQGFLSKLYASPNPIGIISELILAVLNTNVHVYEVSPALTIIEKAVGKALANLFGLRGDHAGGLVQQGGSAANLTALVVARNALFPDVKTEGLGGRRLVLFTSAHGHYSLEKAAQICGLGSKAVWTVGVDACGCMDVAEMRKQIRRARDEGFTPFFVNATAGTTVLGSYDPLVEIADVCQAEKLWFHVDASWGGAVVFSEKLKCKMDGAERADSITYNPHKMLNIPVTCSFLLVADLVKAWKANTLPANYLFHSDGDRDDMDLPDDLADMTLQCGRKGDALKLALAWVYYGSSGFETKIDHAFGIATGFAELVDRSPNLMLVSTRPPPCLQVCFYFAKDERLSYDNDGNSKMTRAVVQRLLSEGFSVDFAPGEHGLFLRVVVNLETLAETTVQLVDKIQLIGLEIEIV